MAAHHFQAAHDRTAEGCRELDFELERRRICGIRGFSTRRSLLGLWASDAWHRQRILRWSLTSVFTSTPVRSSLTSSCLHDVIHLRDAYASIYFAFHYCLLAFFIARITISILLPPSHYPCSHPCPHRRLSFVFISHPPPKHNICQPLSSSSISFLFSIAIYSHSLRMPTQRRTLVRSCHLSRHRPYICSSSSSYILVCLRIPAQRHTPARSPPLPITLSFLFSIAIRLRISIVLLLACIVWHYLLYSVTQSRLYY